MRRFSIRAVLPWLILIVGCSTAPPDAPRDVVLVILDTTRADRLSAYGHPQPTTPNLERLAAEGERYDEAWAQSSWTLPAVASILTGLPPHGHGAGRTSRGMFGLTPGVHTLAESLAGAGYRTAAFMNVVWCSPRISSLDRGFATYDHRGSDESNRGQRDASETTDAALAWLKGAGADPFFLVVHYFDPHLTYDPPAPFDTMFEPPGGPRIAPGFGSASEVFAIRDGSLPLDERERRSLVARYHGELRYTDQQFGRLREGLEQAGRWDGALVVVVGDHGEEFWDHGGFEHGHSHFREMLRVPLLVRRPGGPVGQVRPERVRQIDIAPTVLEFAGLPVPSELPGKLLDGNGAEFAVAEGSLWAGDLVSVRSDRGTVILNRSAGTVAAFGPDDPLERRPLPPEQPGALDLLRLLEALPNLEGRTETPRDPDPEQLEQLRSLGYLQ